jgi:3-dehydroquinate dehydratase-2
VINGPNLDQLGRRQPEIYGRTTLAMLEADLATIGAGLGLEIEFFQSNDEARLIEAVQAVFRGGANVSGVVINPGALTHSSRALGDAIGALSQPVVEVHISNVVEREPFRRQSTIPSSYRIYGRGIGGYSWAIRHIANRLAWPTEQFRYGPLPDQFGDIRSPLGDASGVAVLVHGGLWMHQWTADATEAIAIDLTRRGWMTMNLEYRRVGLGGGWPETFDDLAEALRALPARSGISAERTALVGHSAGGTMVLWAGGMHAGPVAALAPFPDLVQAREDPVWSEPVKRLLAGDLAQPTLYSPQHRPKPLGPAMVASAVEDDISPPSSIAGYAKSHEGVDLLLCDGNHLSFLEPSSSAWGLVVEWLEARKATL